MNKKYLRSAIIGGNEYDGLYHEKYLNEPVKVANGEVVRVLLDNDNIICHVLDEKEETLLLNIDDFTDDIQDEIFRQCVVVKEFDDFIEFFEWLSVCMDAGDKLCVGYDVTESGEYDYDNLVYSYYNSCDRLVGEFFSDGNVYLKF